MVDRLHQGNIRSSNKVYEYPTETFSSGYSLESGNRNIGGNDAGLNRRSGLYVKIGMPSHLGNQSARVHDKEATLCKNHETALFMSSQHHLKESLRKLGYFPPDDSEIPDIPETCLTLVSTLVDDLSHSESRMSRLTTELEVAGTKLRDLNLHVPSPSRSLHCQLT